MIYRNLMAKGIGDFQAGDIADNFNYWASSQNNAMAAHIDFPDPGRLHSTTRLSAPRASYSRVMPRTSCVLAR